MQKVTILRVTADNFWCRKKFSRVAVMSYWVCKHFFMIIGTCRNKQYGRTTRKTLFIYKNVSIWWFLCFDAPSKGTYWICVFVFLSKILQNLRLFELQTPPQQRESVETHQHVYSKVALGSQDYSKTKIVVIQQKEKILKRKKRGGVYLPPPLQFIGVSDRVWSGV